MNWILLTSNIGGEVAVRPGDIVSICEIRNPQPEKGFLTNLSTKTDTFIVRERLSTILQKCQSKTKKKK